MTLSKLVVITGATRGLGEAMAGEFIRLGHTVIGCGRSQKEIEELRASDSQVAAWAKRVLKNHGTPDLLLNNAALINKNAPLWKVSAKEFSAVIDVNIKGVVNVIRHFVPALIERGSGIIINFSSGWGRATDAEVAPYCATKWAIEGLTQALAQELPAGIAAIPLNPGIINTAMLQSCFGSSAQSFPPADAWAKTAVPFLLTLGPRDNGRSLTAP
ncbi:MAG: oxidoreductase [Verrucomicrobia bacterium]|nr:MAG: oxidoreductase [Verrucomicrobiota bacterium]